MMMRSNIRRDVSRRDWARDRFISGFLARLKSGGQVFFESGHLSKHRVDIAYG